MGVVVWINKPVATPEPQPWEAQMIFSFGPTPPVNQGRKNHAGSAEAPYLL